jgi:hypothetical protein
VRKLKLYAPGLFSLLLLFPLLLHQLLLWSIFDKEYMLEVTWHHPVFASDGQQEVPPPRDYAVFNITGNAAKDNIKIEYAKILIYELLVSFDTIKGVHFQFADTAKYHSFIEVLDYCGGQLRAPYAVYENDFWVFMPPPRTGAVRQHSGFSSCMNFTPVNVPNEESNLNVLFDKQFWPITLLFLLLTLVSFIRWRSQFNAR